MKFTPSTEVALTPSPAAAAAGSTADTNQVSTTVMSSSHHITIQPYTRPTILTRITVIRLSSAALPLLPFHPAPLPSIPAALDLLFMQIHIDEPSTMKA
jgi:hypothetical protein